MNSAEQEIAGCIPGPMTLGLRRFHLIREYVMYELNAVEIDAVNGGNRLLKLAEAIGLADMVNDAIKGFTDGFNEGLNDQAQKEKK